MARVSIEENWAEQGRLRAELEALESDALAHDGRRRGNDWEDAIIERIAQVKSDLIALNIEMNLRYRATHKARTG